MAGGPRHPPRLYNTGSAEPYNLLPRFSFRHEYDKAVYVLMNSTGDLGAHSIRAAASLAGKQCSRFACFACTGPRRERSPARCHAAGFAQEASKNIRIGPATPHDPASKEPGTATVSAFIISIVLNPYLS